MPENPLPEKINTPPDPEEKKEESSPETVESKTEIPSENPVVEQPTDTHIPQTRLEDLTFITDTKSKSHSHIFLCRGVNEEMFKDVLNAIESFGLKAVVTNDSKQIKPLAEIITEHASVHFAIILLSADDFVYSVHDKPQNALMKADQRVVFEMGYWIGKLGRDKVFAIHYDQKRFRQPSEFYNTISTPYDKSGLWKKELAKRLKDQNFSVTAP